jgi:hypothetical protein
VECVDQIINSCASGKSCAFDCDDAPDNNMTSVADDAESDDDVFENIGHTATTDNNSYASDSSAEDMKDAFEGFRDAELITKLSKKKVETHDFKTFVKNDNLKRETKTEAKKNTRQKGDADSLKKYAYGKFICVFYFIKETNLGWLYYLLVDLTLMDLGKIADEGCNEECSYDRKCVRRADWYAAYDLRKKFWGKPEEDPYMPKKRLHQIIDIYKYCDAVKVVSPFKFYNKILNFFYSWLSNYVLIIFSMRNDSMTRPSGQFLK